LLPSIIDLHAMAPVVSKSLSNSFEVISLLGSPHVHLLLVDNGRSALLGKVPQNQLLEAAHPSSFSLSKGTEITDIEKLYYGHLGENKVNDIIDSFCIDGYAGKEFVLNLQMDEIVIAARELKAQIDKSESDIIWRSWKSAMMSRKMLNRSSFGPISLMKSFYKRGFGNLRSFPKIEKTSFSERWVKERPDVIESRKLTDIPKGQLLVRRPATDGLD